MGSEAKENAKRAMRELFGSLPGGALEPVKPVEEFDAALPEMPDEEVAVFQGNAKTEVTKIGGDTVITGTIKSSGTMEIRGTVYGDVYSDDNVYLYGRVAGNINCKNFYQYSGAVKGNVTASDNIEIGQSGAILGDLAGANIRADGRISGNVISAGKTELLENAILVGDITTRHIVMRDTACLSGAVHLEAPARDMGNVFNDCFNF